MFSDPFTTEAEQTASVRAARKVVVVGIGALAVLLLAILLLQLRGIVQHYEFYTTTGGETQSVYGIWKVQEGHPLYEWPNKDFYQLTLYNFGFYHLYAGALSLLGARGPSIMLYGRFLTVILAFCGCLLQAKLLRFLVLGQGANGPEGTRHPVSCGFRGRAVAWAICLISFCTWFNSGFPGFYPVSVRPEYRGSGAVHAGSVLPYPVRGGQSDEMDCGCRRSVGDDMVPQASRRGADLRSRHLPGGVPTLDSRGGDVGGLCATGGVGSSVGISGIPMEHPRRSDC